MALFGTVSAGNDVGMKNRIINGAMNIFQRATTTTQNTTANVYALDQWAGFGALTDGVYTMTQASATPPTGFTNYLRATITTADSSIGAGQSYGLRHCIEGYNTTDLGWGASGASSITISFWARSSVTGTYPVTVINDVLTRCYLFTFSLVANTWTYVTQTITGDTTGTWEKTTSSGIKMFFGLGYGSNYLGTTGSWQTTTSTTYLGTATGCTALIATNGATFDLTGVQLEKGSTATAFEWRPYPTELILCQRYYQDFRANINNGGGPLTNSVTGSSGTRVPFAPTLVTMRASPTITPYTTGGTSGSLSEFSAGVNVGATANPNTYNYQGGSGYWQMASAVSNPVYQPNTYSAEL